MFLLLIALMSVTLGQASEYDTNVEKPVKTLVVLPDTDLLSRRDSITAIFEAAVIALGSDWGLDEKSEWNPFHFTGASVPGKVRWCVQFPLWLVLLLGFLRGKRARKTEGWRFSELFVFLF